MSEHATDQLAQVAQLLTAECACASSSQASALLVAVAALIAGQDLAAVLRLPEAGDREHRVVVRRGHMMEIGGIALGQLLRLAGAAPVEVGTVERCREDELAAMLGQGAACGVHVEQGGSDDDPGTAMARFVWTCRTAGVPSIVALLGPVGPVAALDAGADLVVLDAARFRGGPGLGLIVGSSPWVAACRLQARGLGGLFRCAPEALAAAVEAVRAAAADAGVPSPQ